MSGLPLVVNSAPVYKLQELAEVVGGRVRGDASLEIRSLQPFASARSGDLTFASDRKTLDRLDDCSASAIIVRPGVKSSRKTLLEVPNPKVAFASLLAFIQRKPFEPLGISPLAFVGEQCRIPDNVSVHPFAYVGHRVVLGERVTIFPGASVGDDCVIGADVTLHSNGVLYPGIRLGDRVVIHSGTVIGADGFGYVYDGTHQVKIPQTGTVVIGDDVEIGANSCVDRATFGATVIEKGVKLDNHVHIGHNCRIGRNTVIVAQVGISGSVTIGENCVFAGHSGVVDHVTIGDHVTVMMKTGVSKDVPAGKSVSGQPAMDHREAMKVEAVMRRLPEIYREWKRLRKELEESRRHSDGDERNDF